MKRIIDQPVIGEVIPDGAMQYTLTVSGFVVDVRGEDDFVTGGAILYDSLNGIDLPESFVHHFSGWEV